MVTMDTELTKQLDKAKQDFKNKTVIAFLGNTFMGKTVLCTLLKDASAKYLPKSTNNKYRGFATRGRQKINDNISRMYNDKKFPIKTNDMDELDVLIQITSKTNNSIEITFCDMPGEKYENYIEDEIKHKHLESNLKTIMDHGKGENEEYGTMAHLIFGKIYVILIDCSKYNDWQGEQSKIVSTIQNIHEYKNYIDKNVDGKIYSPICIVFTKYDTLDSKHKKPANELFDGLEELKSAFAEYVKHPPECFISEISTRLLTTIESNEIIDNHLHENDVDYMNNKKIMVEKTEESKNIKTSISEAHKKINELKTQIEDLENDPNVNDDGPINAVNDDLIKSKNDLKKLNNKYNIVNSEHRNAKKMMDIIDSKRNDGIRPTLREIGEPEQRLTDPFKYNHEDYVNMVKWFIKMHNNFGNN